jgi:hypothetical protein
MTAVSDGVRLPSPAGELVVELIELGDART